MRIFFALTFTFFATGAHARGHFDVYLWQRSGSAHSVANSATKSGTDVTDIGADVRTFVDVSDGRVHVLAADDAFTSNDPRIRRALATTAAPTVLTFRFTALPTVPVAQARIQAQVLAFEAAGVSVVGVEVDHDCATSALPHYGQWLLALSPTLTQPLSITALPTWLTDRAHEAVFAAAAEVTLQVHAIAAPALFDPMAALQAMARAPQLRVALPTYAVTLKNGPALFTNVADVAAVRVHADDVTYFRMPVAGDDAAFGWPTLLAVDSAAAVVTTQPTIRVHLVATPSGAFDVVVENDGPWDAPMRAVQVLGADAADVLGDVVLRRIDGGVVFVGQSARYLPPQARRTLGWVRPHAKTELPPGSPTGSHTERRPRSATDDHAAHDAEPLRAAVVHDPRGVVRPERDPAALPVQLQPSKHRLRPVLP
jgi:hypothetical protein